MDTDQLRLKERTRCLHKAVGGLEEAARITGKSKSQHGRCQSPESGDFLTIHDLAELEAVAPRTGNWPPVTRLLCERLGGVFLPLPDLDACDDPLGNGVAAMAREFAELTAAVMTARADGRVDPHELLPIRREGRQLVAALTRFLNGVDALIEEDTPSAHALRAVEG